MKKILLITTVALLAFNLQAQKLISKSGFVKFYSYTPVEEIEAKTSQAASILDSQSGSVQVSLLIRSFSFKKELMQEHFNENYMESSTYPKASFMGKITNLPEINFEKDGIYEANVDGEITIHGVTKALATPVSITVKKGLVTAEASFTVLTEDFKIEIPDVVKEKIAKEIEVSLSIPYQKN